MIKVFDRSVYGREASRLLAVLHQGERSVADFAIEFRTLATTCEWNEPALVGFLEGLNIDLREEIYAREPPAQFDQLVELAIRLEKCLSNGGASEDPSPDSEKPRLQLLIHLFPDQNPNPCSWVAFASLRLSDSDVS